MLCCVIMEVDCRRRKNAESLRWMVVVGSGQRGGPVPGRAESKSRYPCSTIGRIRRYIGRYETHL